LEIWKDELAQLAQTDFTRGAKACATWGWDVDLAVISERNDQREAD
jgi:hypothetical protein